MKTLDILRAILPVAVLLTIGTISAFGQAVMGLAPGSKSTAGANKPFKPGPARKPLAAELASSFSNQGPLAQWGLIAVRPHLSYGIIYADDILRVPGEPENTTMHTVSPGVLMELGKHWTLDYALTRRSYSSRLLFNTTDHNTTLQGGVSYGDWTFGLSQSYGSNSPTLVETGGQTHEETYSTGANVMYRLGSRSLFDITMNRSSRKANPLTSSTFWTGSDWVQWSASTWFRYRISDQFTVGIGVVEGYDEVSANPNMSYTQPQGNITWLPTDKITLSVDGGVEDRKTHAVGARSDRNTVYRASFKYLPFQTTSLTFSRSQNVSTSYFSDQSTKNNGWELRIEQRLLRRFFLTAGASHGRTTYLATTTLSATGRYDEYDTVDVGLSTTFLRRGSVSISYRESENVSKHAIFSFKGHQIGMDFAYRF